ncbi:MAG: hypothetical protein K1X94_08475 [Sandaracinaceae bacterium]|nr:hypothetical protein [Sandaracinaceae bacterium]
MERALVLFVATRASEVPAGLVRYASVDGSVPGAALVWDHHVTGEPVSLDALPERIDLAGLDGLGTTLADTDAIVGAVVALAGGPSRVDPATLAILRAASWWCDHLRGAPGVEGEADRLGRGLHEHCAQALAKRPRSESGQVFAALVLELEAALARGGPLPFAEIPEDNTPDLRVMGRITEHGAVALVDLRGLGAPLDPLRAYAQHRCPVAVTVADHSKGGTRFTVGVNPHVPSSPTDLGPALAAIAQAEHAHGPPCLSPSHGPGTENWGGRATVFGSPWNYGSRLAPHDVVALVRQALATIATKR